MSTFAVLLNIRNAHPDYILPTSKQAAKAVPPKPPTPFKLFSEEKMAKFLAEGMTSSEARCEFFSFLKKKFDFRDFQHFFILINYPFCLKTISFIPESDVEKHTRS